MATEIQFWCLESNGGRSRGTFRRQPSHPRDFSETLRAMDGGRQFARVLWPFPEGVDPADKGAPTSSPAFLQCAGSADAMEIEIREPSTKGGFVLSTIGVGEPGELTEPIGRAGHTDSVAVSEVFTNETAVAVFDEYFATKTLSDAWHRRPIETWEAQR